MAASPLSPLLVLLHVLYREVASRMLRMRYNVLSLDAGELPAWRGLLREMSCVLCVPCRAVHALEWRRQHAGGRTAVATTGVHIACHCLAPCRCQPPRRPLSLLQGPTILKVRGGVARRVPRWVVSFPPTPAAAPTRTP